MYGLKDSQALITRQSKRSNSYTKEQLAPRGVLTSLERQKRTLVGKPQYLELWLSLKEIKLIHIHGATRFVQSSSEFLSSFKEAAKFGQGARGQNLNPLREFTDI